MTALVTVEASSLRRRKLGDVVGRSLWERGSGGWGGNGSSYGKRRQPESFSFTMLDRIPCSVVVHLTVAALNDAGESAPAVPDSEALNRCFPVRRADGRTYGRTVRGPVRGAVASAVAGAVHGDTLDRRAVHVEADLRPDGAPGQPDAAARGGADGRAEPRAVDGRAECRADRGAVTPAVAGAVHGDTLDGRTVLVEANLRPDGAPGNPTRPPAAPPTRRASRRRRRAERRADRAPRQPDARAAPRPSAVPTTAAPSAAPTAAPVEFAVAIDFVLPDGTVNSCEDTALELHDGSKVDGGFFAAALGLSEDAVETVATCGGATNFSRASRSVTPSRSRRRRLLAANATNATAAPNVTGCSEVRADVTMFDYEINAYLASLGRRLATYEDLDDAEAAIQAMIEGYYGLNETAEATEICGGFSVDVSVVYYPTPAPTSAPPSPPPSPAPSTATPSTAAPSSSRPTYAPTALPGNPTRPPAAAPTDAEPRAVDGRASAAPTALPATQRASAAAQRAADDGRAVRGADGGARRVRRRRRLWLI
ncbi:hypothetical protein JL720_5092 [Aureococcus anophagefferens]|nr:hypothetical protein JL720_5092 [Aureococcus anophagefferens]